MYPMPYIAPHCIADTADPRFHQDDIESGVPDGAGNITVPATHIQNRPDKAEGVSLPGECNHSYA
ncbi:hypothetical protein SAMN05421819_1290 [Bryocella elongata]|uniref:Uncharacterized protein n=1 Tax=Bryocella elongata TaxID=863522 RepID=A0A1H5VS55_9BACT|nr:hypothetical protein SAMN05421819_1290 [Bryocella elongata]